MVWLVGVAMVVVFLLVSVGVRCGAGGGGGGVGVVGLVCCVLFAWWFLGGGAVVRCFWWSCLCFRWSLAGWFRFCPCVLGGLPTPRPPGRGPSPPSPPCLVGPSPSRGRYGCPYCPSASRRRRRRPLLAGSGWHVVRVWVAPGGGFFPCEGGHLPVPPLITRLRPSPCLCAIHVRGLLC